MSECADVASSSLRRAADPIKSPTNKLKNLVNVFLRGFSAAIDPDVLDSRLRCERTRLSR